jgi:hypothetical protein
MSAPQRSPPAGQAAKGFDQPKPSSRMTLYATSVRLPSLHELMNPKGSGEALRGTVLPISPQAADDWQHRAMVAGEFSLMHPDSGACFQLEVHSGTGRPRPKVLDASDDEKWSLAVDLEMEQKLKSRTWEVSLALDVQSARLAGDAKQAVGVMMNLVDRLAEPTHAAVCDVEGRRYFEKGGWKWPGGGTGFDVRDHVTVHVIPMPSEGTRKSWCHTHGMIKFGRCEMEFFDVPDSLREPAAELLWDLGNAAVTGRGFEPLEKVGSESFPLLVRKSTRSPAAHFQGPVLELVDLHGPGRPAEKGAPMALAARADDAKRVPFEE